MWKLKNILTGETSDCPQEPVFVGGIWECGAFRITDVDGTSYEAIPPAVVVELKTTLTKLEYMNRFTDTELAGIYTAAKSAIQVEVWLEKFKLATDISLTDQRTVEGLQALEAAGLLAVGRASEILMP